VVTESDKLADAERILQIELDAIDRTCSRFRSDSELASLQRHDGRSTVVSPLLFTALETAVAVAEMTSGAVDPTVGNALATLGYDCDFDLINCGAAPAPIALAPAVGYGCIELNTRARTVRMPKDVRLDLGSTAKALAADNAARRIADQLGASTLVSLGGDVSVAGPSPVGGWAIGIAVDSSMPGPECDHVVAIREGGLASSSTAVRTWRRGGVQVHHIIDPATGNCAPSYWELVSANGRSCVDANALSTAAVVWGEEALDHLAIFHQAVRLVRFDGAVFVSGGWPRAESI
jgi:FAD:protein FMN transferase